MTLEVQCMNSCWWGPGGPPSLLTWMNHHCEMDCRVSHDVCCASWPQGVPILEVKRHRRVEFSFLNFCVYICSLYSFG